MSRDPTPEAHGAVRRIDRNWRALWDHVLLSVGACVMCAPLFLVFWGAGRDGGMDGARGAASSVEGFLSNLDRVAELARNTGAPPLAGMIGSSLVLAVAIAAVTTTFAFLAAFAMLRAPGRISNACFWLTLATLLFPIEARMLHTFDVTATLGLINGWAGMVLPVLPLALGTLVFRQHFKVMPPELGEAARLDGAGTLVFLRDFAVPLSKAPIGAVFLIVFIYGWSQYLWPLMVSVDDGVYPLMRGLNLAGSGSGAGLTIAAVSMVPPLLIVLAFLKLLTRVTALRD